MEKAAFKIRYEGQWVEGDDNVTRYVGGNERGICIDTNVDFDGFIARINYRLRLDQRQLTVCVFIVGDMSPMEIVDDDNVEFFMVVARSSQGYTKRLLPRVKLTKRPINKVKMFMMKKGKIIRQMSGHIHKVFKFSRVFNNMDEDYNVEGNEEEEEEKDDDDEDEEFSGFDDDIYGVQSQDVGRSQSHACYNEAECSIRCHGFMNIRAYPTHIHNPNPFQWVPKLAVDVENAGITN